MTHHISAAGIGFDFIPRGVFWVHWTSSTPGNGSRPSTARPGPSRGSRRRPAAPALAGRRFPGRPDGGLGSGPARAARQWRLAGRCPSRPRHAARAFWTAQVKARRVVKELSVQDGHPFVYQRHLFIGGTGALPVANHAMVSVPNGAKLSFSRKRWWETLADPLETTRAGRASPIPADPRMRPSFPARMAARSTFTATPGARRTRISWPASKTRRRALAGPPSSGRRRVTFTCRSAIPRSCR